MADFIFIGLLLLALGIVLALVWAIAMFLLPFNQRARASKRYWLVVGLVGASVGVIVWQREAIGTIMLFVVHLLS